jgi:hypothetical protein
VTTSGQSATARVRYREGQLLRAGDLTAEQAHRLALRRRHDRGSHVWGIVTGLALEGRPEGVLVNEGVAADGYGRVLVVAQPLLIAAATIEPLAAAADVRAIDVWLLYDRVPATPPRAGRSDCGPGRHSRWREAPKLRLTTLEDPDAEVDERRPVEVPGADLAAGPEAPSPDNPDREWPVRLGRVTWDAGRLQVDLAGRPLAGLLGEAVVAPAGNARLQVGSEAPGDRLRFLVAAAPAGGTPVTRLAVDRDGAARVDAAAGVDGQLSIADGRLRFTGAPPPAAPAPWRIYRAVAAEEGQPSADDLRVEIGHPGTEGDPVRYRLAVGHAAGASFERCLTVRADCALVVRKEALVLDPARLVVRAPAAPDPEDPRVAAALIEQWLRSIVNAGVSLDKLFAGRLTVEFGAVTPVNPGQQLSYKVTVTNAGAAPVLGITVAVTVAIGGTSAPGAVWSRDALAPGAQFITPTGTISIPNTAGGKTVVLSAAAVGFGQTPPLPHPYPVLAPVTQKTVTIPVPPP